MKKSQTVFGWDFLSQHLLYNLYSKGSMLLILIKYTSSTALKFVIFLVSISRRSNATYIRSTHTIYIYNWSRNTLYVQTQTYKVTDHTRFTSKCHFQYRFYFSYSRTFLHFIVVHDSMHYTYSSVTCSWYLEQCYYNDNSLIV